jgi:hypothetical protein
VGEVCYGERSGGKLLLFWILSGCALSSFW